jgi:hypothetical protein
MYDSKYGEYKVIENRDLLNIIKDHPMDYPISVFTYRGVPCSIFGSPLRHQTENGYLEVERSYNTKTQERFRQNGWITLIHHENNTDQKGNRYVIAEDVNHEILLPIMEVTNHGRGSLRCKQWAKTLNLAFDDKHDEQRMSVHQYTKLLQILSERLTQSTS